MSSLDGCFKGFVKGQGALIQFGYFDRSRRFYPSHVSLTNAGESPAEVKSILEIIDRDMDPRQFIGPKHVSDQIS